MKIAGVCRTAAAFFAALVLLVAPLSAADTDSRLREQQLQLQQLRVYVDQAAAQLRLLNAQLKEAQERSRRQTQLINQLEAALAEQRGTDPGWQRRWRLNFFAALKRQLAASPIYRIEADRLVIATDSVFVFSRGEIGAEGQDRLKALGPALLKASALLPPSLDWRLQIEGHTDSRPLRNNPRFANNWQLSAARALALLELWRGQGVPESRMSALALGQTRPAVVGDSKAIHRRNRRIEIRLGFHPVSD